MVPRVGVGLRIDMDCGMLGLHGVRCVFDHRHPAQLGMLHNVVARHEVDERGSELLRQSFSKLKLLVGLAFIADQAA